MKKVYSLFTLVFLSVVSIAQNSSNLVVFSEDGLKFYLILNGIRQNDVPVTNVKVVDLIQPYYSAKIIFEDPKQPVLEKKILQLTDAEGKGNLEITYKIKRNNKQVNVLRFFSQVPIAQATPVSQDVAVYHYNVTPMPEISTTVVTQETTVTSGSNVNTSAGTNGTSTNVNVNMGGMGVNMNVNINEPNINATTTSTSYTTTTTTTTSNNNVNNYTNTSVQNNSNTSTSCDASYAMNSSSFSSAKQTITKQSFEDTKLTTVKQILKSNCLSSAQIKEVMLLFNFEANRLEVAKIAHNRCVDKNNYFLLNDAFQFESSVEELNESIK